MHLFKGVVIATLLYGSETWVPSAPPPPAEEVAGIHYVVSASDSGGYQVGSEAEH